MDVRSTRRALVARLARLSAAVALPTGAVAAAIPAALDTPTVEILPEWVMPVDVRLFVVGFVGDTPEDDFCVRADVTVAADGAFDVALFRGSVDEPDQVGGYGGTGQEPAGSALSILLHGMMVAGRKGLHTR